ncbi:ABC transporter ATP-binding protein|uniref:ATP-binding cassette, subfamily B n=1 Tax=Dendrosporobacter quercicolus TaxID=146817 RepID=A0A1G9XHG3_9FIRM|nr:ABC transporter ATP-binding protein [Dendrosporobacter quercicolus]NSL49663.1 ABC transporter ATP-binding protein [Dendrosporobacter quercicolus DSM 1736]SDM96188.1 ATP-binding cassette, subfamily B [Dendrosporobacter quercicolus]
MANQPMTGGRLSRRGKKTGSKAKSFTGTLRRLWRYLAAEKNCLAIISLLVCVDILLTLLGPYLIGVYVDAIAVDSGAIDFDLLKLLLVILGGAYVGESVLAFVKNWLMAGVSQRVVGELRRSLFGKLQKLPVAFFDRHPHGELMSRLANDIDQVSGTIAQSSVQLISGFIAITGSFIMMLVLSPLLTLASLITVPLVLLLSRTIARKTAVLFKEQQVQLGRLNSQVEETVSGIEVIRAFNYEQQAIDEFKTINQELTAVGTKAQIWSGFMMPLMNVINNIGFAAIAIAGGALAVQEVVTVGIIASFISYSRQFVRPLNDLGNIYNILQSGVAGAERVFEILDEQEELPDQRGAKLLAQPRGQVAFENVSFGYQEGLPILHNIHFSVKAGSVTALVGPTGAGKTTIINLLTRFYDVNSGRILIDGGDIREYSRDSLRKCFGIVLQDTYLFSGTIRDNIKYGRPEAADEEVKAAALQANAHYFIERLPRQYDTILTENGGNLSHGEKQLLALARVILTNPAILILDEATSSIDTRTEFYIQDALRRMMAGRTSFVIAHRLNTIRHADVILVISRGTIVEQGRHEELLAQRGAYYRLQQPLTEQFQDQAAIR